MLAVVGHTHDDDVVGAGLEHHLGFESGAVHCFEVGDDGMVGEGLAHGADAVEAFGEDQGCAGFKPVDAGAYGCAGHVEGFVD